MDHQHKSHLRFRACVLSKEVHKSSQKNRDSVLERASEAPAVVDRVVPACEARAPGKGCGKLACWRLRGP
jgi:hypothetical protein